MDGTSNKSSVQQRDIEAQTAEDETTQVYANFIEQLPQIGEGATNYYNFQIQEPKYEGLSNDSFHASTAYDPLRFH